MAKKKKTKATIFKKYNRIIWVGFGGGVLSVILLFSLAALGFFGPLPTFEELENPENNLATEVISIDGKTLGKYYHENRTPVNFRDLPKNLVQALIATEDERFYEHSGIDVRGTARAVIKLGKGGGASTITQQLAKMLFTKRASGNIFKRVIQKAKEWVIAIQLERQYTKHEIITMYLNKYDFLNLAVGIRSASRIYFGKEPKNLNIEEAAMLVGMLKNASYFNPLRRPKKVQKRRNTVLNQMLRNKFITKKERDSLSKITLTLDLHREDTNDGTATYFREYMRDFMKRWVKTHKKPDGSKYNIYRDGLKIYVTLDSRMQRYAEKAVNRHMANLQKAFFKQQKENAFAPFVYVPSKALKKAIKQEIDTAQLRVMKELEDSTFVASTERILKTTMRRSGRYKRMKKSKASEAEIDSAFNAKRPMHVFSWQGEKDTIMSPLDSIRYYKYFLQTGVLSVEPQTGHVKVWVGGINYKYFKYDHAKQGRRQVGSTFKPFVYATVINQLKISPCEKYPNIPYTIPAGTFGIPEDWTPGNSGGKYGGILTLKQALAKSINVITARMMYKVGPKNVKRLARSLGITGYIPEVPSIALGTVDISLYDMVGAYSAFANQGMYIKPMVILRIEDKNGTVLENFSPETREVLSKEAAYTVINLLEGVTQFGSGIRLRTNTGVYPDSIATGYPYEFKNPIAGKTGTTQNQSDGWFMGIVPNLATGVWVGGENRSIHFNGITRGQGASMALPIWALYMKQVYKDSTLHISKEAFEKPEHISINLDCNTFNKDPKIKDVPQDDPEF
ncbi:MAG: transglycosylase domain-containing protein [Flavobacteriaceae bacterium]|nr:transglycosylase domain-containing protein [Flavobacteriaceae bacterium]